MSTLSTTTRFSAQVPCLCPSCGSPEVRMLEILHSFLSLFSLGPHQEWAHLCSLHAVLLEGAVVSEFQGFSCWFQGTLLYTHLRVTGTFELVWKISQGGFVTMKSLCGEAWTAYPAILQVSFLDGFLSNTLHVVDFVTLCELCYI